MFLKLRGGERSFSFKIEGVREKEVERLKLCPNQIIPSVACLVIAKEQY